LVGANGAGKTTLLHLAIGLLRPTKGTVRMFGEPPRLDQSDKLARIGFVAQDHPLYRRFTVADLLHFGRSTNRHFDLTGARNRLSGIGIALDRRASALSGGQQAQVARRDFFRTLLDAVAGSDLTVVLSSHVVAELERVCDHVVLLHEGRV
jgi:ABC-2 type transport system ATP-binding protein